jgi:hypothetical protein
MQVQTWLYILSTDTTYFPSYMQLVKASKSEGSAQAAIKATAERCFILKPGSLEHLTSSLFDILEEVFLQHFMTEEKLLPDSFLSLESPTHQAEFTLYANNIISRVRQFFGKRTSTEHRDAIVARLYYYFFMDQRHLFTPFLTRSMAIAIDRRLSQCQQGLADVSVFYFAIQTPVMDRSAIMRFLLNLKRISCDPCPLSGSPIFLIFRSSSLTP